MYEVIIIGSGSAGYTAAIYSCRAGRKTLLIAGSIPGGQLMLTSDVENFPGFPESIVGPELMEQMRKQAERFGPEIVYDDASDVDFKSRPFNVTVGKKTYEGKTVIISTGANAKWLGIPSETKFRGHGVSSCATCDGYFLRKKTWSWLAEETRQWRKRRSSRTSRRRSPLYIVGTSYEPAK